jgi:hypothetical protein
MFGLAPQLLSSHARASTSSRHMPTSPLLPMLLMETFGMPFTACKWRAIYLLLVLQLSM